MSWSSRAGDITLRQAVDVLLDPTVLSRLAVLIGALLATKVAVEYSRTASAVPFVWPAPKACVIVLLSRFAEHLCV